LHVFAPFMIPFALSGGFPPFIPVITIAFYSPYLIDLLMLPKSTRLHFVHRAFHTTPHQLDKKVKNWQFKPKTTNAKSFDYIYKIVSNRYDVYSPQSKQNQISVNSITLADDASKSALYNADLLPFEVLYKKTDSQKYNSHKIIEQFLLTNTFEHIKFVPYDETAKNLKVKISNTGCAKKINYGAQYQCMSSYLNLSLLENDNVISSVNQVKSTKIKSGFKELFQNIKQ